MGTVVGWRGVGVELDAPPDLVAALRPHLPPFFDDPGDAVATGVLRRDGEWLTLGLPDDLGIAGPAGPETLRAVASRIELLIADRLPDLVAVHSGVVAIEGRAVLLPGSSMAGKSTLVRALLEAGATYLSDEFALLTDDGRVRPYPRRMTIRTPSGSERHVPPQAAPVDAEPFPVALVALLTFDAGSWSVEPLTPGQAVLGLVANGVSVRRAPERAMTAFAALVRSAAAVTGTRGEAAEAAEHIRRLV